MTEQYEWFFDERILESNGLISADCIPTFDRLEGADEHQLRALFSYRIAVRIDDWISEPAWAPRDSLQASSRPDPAAWRQLRSSKKASRSLRKKISHQSFAYAVGYLAKAEIALYLAWHNAYRQRADILKEMTESTAELGRMPLSTSSKPFRPYIDETYEKAIGQGLPSPTRVEPLFEETAYLYDLIFLTHQDGIERLHERTPEFRRSTLGSTNSTPYESRLSDPDWRGTSGDEPFSDILDQHINYSLSPFAIQVMEHCYAILSGSVPQPGILLSGPISENGGLDAFFGFAQSRALISASYYDGQVLGRILMLMGQ